MIEEDVLLDAEIRKEAQLLVNEGDAERERVARICRRNLFPGELDAAAVPGQHAAEDVHRRRLAGAVLADEAENGAAAQLESDVAQHLDAEEALVEPADLEEQVGHRLSPEPSACGGSRRSLPRAE